MDTVCSFIWVDHHVWTLVWSFIRVDCVNGHWSGYTSGLIYWANGQWYAWSFIWVDYCVSEHWSDHSSGLISVQKVTTSELNCHSWRILYTRSQCLCLTSQVLRFHNILLPSFWNIAYFWTIVCFWSWLSITIVLIMSKKCEYLELI